MSMVSQVSRTMTTLPLEEDDGFVARLAGLDETAWKTLVEGWTGPIYKFAYFRTGDPHLAEEIAAEAFAEAVKGIGRFRYKGAPVSAWVFRIARNLTADYLSRRKRQPVVSLEGTDPSSSDRHLANLETRLDVRDALGRLNPDQQEVLILRFFNELRPSEVAQVTGKSISNVKVIQHRALAKLREQLGAIERRK